MSVRTRLSTAGGKATTLDGTPLETEAPLFRLLALGASLVAIAASLSVFYEVTVVVGGTLRLIAVVLGAFLAATVLSLLVSERTAAIVAVVMGVLGGAWYLVRLPDVFDPATYLTGAAVTDTLALTTGVSVLHITEASVWAAAVAPLPVFLTWYLALRRRYALAGLAGGAMVLFLVLTGDLGLVGALAGVLACLCTVSFGELELRGGTTGQLDMLIVLLAVMAVSGLFVTVVPAGDGPTLSGEGFGTGFSGDGDGSSDLEGNLMSDDGQLTVSGEVDLTPEVRFTVAAEEPRRWRVETFDRYTGDGWINTHESEAYEGELDEPDGMSRSVRQHYRLETRASSMPAAAHPVEVHGDTANLTLVREDGSLTPRAGFTQGDEYVVDSEVPTSTAGALNASGTDYSDEIEERYTQLPDTTPDRVGDLTDDVTEPAATPYQQALVIERYLQDQKEYSLSVERPDGDIADQFLFEMEAGYCTYYATTMVTMLRTQDVPARMAVGYNSGQSVDEDTYVVRGSDAHAWVEVYFEGHGWVEFDPTPSADWEQARSSAVAEGRLDEDLDVQVDTEETVDEPYLQDDEEAEPDDQSDPLHGGVLDTEYDGTPDAPTAGVPTVDDVTEDEAEALLGEAYDDADDAGFEEYDEQEAGAFVRVRSALPSGEAITLALALLVGTVAGARRTGATARARRTVELYWQRPSDDPDDDARRAGDRVERYLERKYRTRDPTESRQEYLEGLPFSLDNRVYRVFDVAERAEYGDGVDREEAREAIDLADELVGESMPVLRRFRKSRSV